MRLSNIAIYDKSTIDFYNQGLGILSDAISSESTEAVQDNGNITYEMTLKYPINGVLADKLKLPNLIRAQESEDPNDFMIFEIYDYDEDDDGEMTVYAQALPYRVLRLPFNDEAKFATKYNDVQELFDDAIKRVTGFPTWFKINSDVKLASNLNFKDSQFENLGKLLEATMSLIDATVEYQWNQINILQSRGRDLSDIVLRDDKNTNGVKITGSYEKIVNKVVPIIRNRNETTGEFEDGTHMGSVVTSKDPFKWIPYYAGVTAAFDSQEEANNYISSNKLDNPAITVDVSPLMVDEDLTQVHTFDRITAYSTKLKYQDTLQVTTRVFDQLNAEVVSFKMGSIKKDINSTTSYTLSSLASEIARAQNIARGAARSADGKNTNYYAEATPTNQIEGDLWFHKIDGKDIMQQYINGEWTTIVKDGMGEEIQAYVDQKMLENDEALAGLNTKLQDNDEVLAGLNTKLQDNDEAMDKLHTDLESNTQTIKDNKQAVDDAMGKVNENLTQAQADAAQAVSDADQALANAKSSADASGLATQTANAASDAATAAKQLSTEVSNNFAIVKTQAATAVNDAATALDQAKSAVDKAESTASEFGKVSQKTDSAVASALAAQNAASSAVSQASSAAADSKDAKQIAGEVSQSYKTLTDGSTMTIAELEGGLAVKLTRADLDGYATQTWAQNQINVSANGINGTISSVKSTVDGQTTSINDLKADSSSFKSQFTTVNNTLGKQTTDISTLQASSKELTSGFNTLTTDNTTNKNDISQLKQTATEVSSTLETVQTQVQNSAVGTNLIVRSSLISGYISREDGSIVSSSNADFHSDNYIATNGETVFTLSSPDYVFRGSNNHLLQMYDSNKNSMGCQNITSATQTLSKSNVAYIRLSINFVDEGGTSGHLSDWLDHHRYKLEKGSVPTEYSIVTAMSKLSQTVDGMQTDISKKIEHKDLNGYATQTWAQNQIKLTADGINGTMSSIKSTVDGQTTSINDLKADSSSFKSQFTTVNNTLGKQTTDIGTLQASSKELTSGFNTLTTDNGTNKNDISQLKQTATELNSTITTVQTQVQNSAVGTNLLTGTSSELKTMQLTNGWNVGPQATNGNFKIKVVKGQTYTYRAWLDNINGPNDAYVNIRFIAIGTTANSNLGNGSHIDKGESGYSTLQIIPPEDGHVLLTPFAHGIQVTALVGWKEEKFEKGSLATDWCANPADNATVTAVSKISQTVDGFSTTFAKQTDLATTASNLKVTADGLNLLTTATGTKGEKVTQVIADVNNIKTTMTGANGVTTRLQTLEGFRTTATSNITNIQTQQTTLAGQYTSLIESTDNKVRKPWFDDGQAGTWSGSNAVVASDSNVQKLTGHSRYLKVFNRDNHESGVGWFSVTPGEVYYFSGYMGSWGTTYPVNVGLQFITEAGTNSWSPATGFPANRKTPMSAITGSITVPAGVVRAQTWVQIDGPKGKDLGYAAISGLRISKSASGSQITQLQDNIDLRVKVDNKVTAALSLSADGGGTVTIRGASLYVTAASHFDNASIQSAAIANLDAAKITSGSISSDRLVTTKLNADNITSGSIAAARIATTALSATNITSGTFDASKMTVKNLSADLIASGTIDALKITVKNLSASNIIGGELDAGLVNVKNLSASKLTAGTIDAGKINVVNLNASNITTGIITGIDIISQNAQQRVEMYNGTVSVTDGVTSTNLSSSGFINHRTIDTYYLSFVSQGMSIKADSANTGLARNAGLELYGDTSYIDFHDSVSATDDYGARIGFSEGDGSKQLRVYNPTGSIVIRSKKDAPINLQGASVNIRNDNNTGWVAAYASVFSSQSAHSLKENFQLIDDNRLLQAVTSTDIVGYNFKGSSQRYCSFVINDDGLSPYYTDPILIDDGGTSFNSTTVTGVMMGAIKALNSKLNDLNAKYEAVVNYNSYLLNSMEEPK